VGDEQVGEPQFPLQLGHQFQEERADGYVCHGDGLVGQHEIRPRDECPRDDDALPLAAGNLVRVLVIIHRCRSKAHAVEHRQHQVAMLGGALGIVDLQGMRDRGAYRHARVQ